MNLSAVTVLVETGFAILLLVTIVYAVKLNTRISRLRGRDTELREMTEQFYEASTQARDAVLALKSAGIDVDRRLGASIDRAQALRDDLAYMIEHGERIADRIEHAPIHQPLAPGPASDPVGAAQLASGGGADEDRRYRSEIEQALAKVIRSTAMAD